VQLHDAYALTIGVSRYLHISPLPEVQDASDVAAVLADPALGGYPLANVQLLLDGEATRAAIVDALDGLAKRTRDSSTVFVYFSGHGGRARATGHDTCYLMPVDGKATSEDIESTAVSGVELSARLRAIPAARMTVVLDCCRASGIAEPKDVELVLSPELSPLLLTPLAQGRGRAVLAASRSDGYAYVIPGQRNGVFTRYLLDGLRGAAQGIGGVIRICDLFHYVQQRVTAERAAQRPVFKAELEENYPIALYHGGVASNVALRRTPDHFTYDAFVSYRRNNSTDRVWVETVLVPRLEQLGLRLCLEHRDFRFAHPRLREMERAVEHSRYTISVLTPAYLEGGFEDFQSLLSQHASWANRVPRFVPIIRLPCRPSLGVQVILKPLLDFTNDEEVDAGLQRLALELREPLQGGYDA
jgi:hypothetical protein